MADFPEEPLTPDSFVQEGEQPVAETPEAPEEPVADEPEEEQPEDNPAPSEEPEEEPAPATDELPVEEPEPEEEPVPTDPIQELSEITNLELKSMTDVVDALAEYKKFKENPFAQLGISSQIQAAIEAEKAGISPAKFFSLSGIDPEKMGKKDLLRQNYHLANPDDAETDPEFLNMRFDREFESKYGILNEQKTDNDFDSDAEWLQYQRERQFAEKSLENESRKAKTAIDSWKQKSLAPQQQGPSKEEIDRQTRAYELETQQVMKNLKHLTVKIGKSDYNITAKPEEISKVQHYLNNPLEYLKEIGIDVSANKVDQKKFSESVLLNLLRDTMAERIAVHKTEMKNKSIVNKIETNTPRQTVPRHNNGQMDDLLEAATLHKQKMKY